MNVPLLSVAVVIATVPFGYLSSMDTLPIGTSPLSLLSISSSTCPAMVRNRSSMKSPSVTFLPPPSWTVIVLSNKSPSGSETSMSP